VAAEAKIVTAGLGSVPHSRMVFLDALRGVAALVVAWYHIYNFGLRDSLTTVVPRPLDYAIKHGYLGVAVFFVLSGFVIAKSIDGVQVTRQYLGRFALRRSLRLDPPYWVTLAIASVLLFLAHRPISGDQILAHVFYLQGILGYNQIVSVFWTLSFEIQFYLVLVIFVWAAQYYGGPMRWVVGAVPFLISLGYMATRHIADGFFIDLWYAFALGAGAFWMLRGQLSPKLWLTAVALTAVAAAFAVDATDITSAGVVATALLIAFVGARGKLASWTGGPLLQYLGRISYSLYLMHFTGNTIARMGGARKPGVGEALAWFALATIVSIGSAHALHVLVERPAQRLSKRIGYSGPLFRPAPREAGGEALAG
jgi:peptidoglycan/LPS O-acetylase OafA/YrhL